MIRFSIGPDKSSAYEWVIRFYYDTKSGECSDWIFSPFDEVVMDGPFELVRERAIRQAEHLAIPTRMFNADGTEVMTDDKS